LPAAVAVENLAVAVELVDLQSLLLNLFQVLNQSPLVQVARVNTA
jgi:hypothetical protein